MPQCGAIRAIFNDIDSYVPGLVRPFEFYGDPTGVRAQLRAARARLQAKIEELMPFISDVQTKDNVMSSAVSEASDKRRVFVVFGRNTAARDAMFTFLRGIDLEPIEWEQAVAMTGQRSPYIAGRA